MPRHASLAGAGYTYKEIGARLYLTPRTVKYHMGEIMHRLQLTTRAELIAYLRIDLRADSLRTDRRFARLLRQLRLP